MISVLEDAEPSGDSLDGVGVSSLHAMGFVS
jgi:hypothetical protein